ncbi:MAG: hypothetical protein IPJ89_02020 [Candidatus Iainarchaeum archaeon]|uniref:Uncharacterized protein n=1 Tax=Candidatus Iainarchaeum sp. TaxID=3101447 RepID=A0A7T9DKJ6_9ARCH|nr:MAG: hypothetical protein IPJ89_02020 [Candidatus Diapherotrites archaeon]
MALDIAVSRKALVVGILIFVFTLAWGFFFSTLELTPDALLSTTGSLGSLAKVLTLNFLAFAIFFSLAIATIMVYANKDMKRTAILISVVPTLVAFLLLGLIFPAFASWFILGIFYVACIPLMVITSHVKQQEMKILPVLRANFSVSHRFMQILGLGVIVALAFSAFPQSTKLYVGFEQSLFSGDIIKSLDVESASADFLIKSQKETLTLLTQSPEYVAVAAASDPEDVQFTSLMQASIQKVDSPAYRAQVEDEVRNQKKSLRTDDVIAQLKTKLPQFQLLQQYYWLVASFLGAIIFFVAATFVIQPLTAVLGVGMDRFIPGEAEPLIVEEPVAQPPTQAVEQPFPAAPLSPDAPLVSDSTPMSPSSDDSANLSNPPSNGQM